LSAERNRGLLRVIQDQKIAAARVLHDGFEMLEIDEIGAMGLKGLKCAKLSPSAK
jgi:hypothetical protein